MGFECKEMYSLSKIRGPRDSGYENESSARFDSMCCVRLRSDISD